MSSNLCRILLFSTFFSRAYFEAQNEEGRLIDDLLRNYNKNARPVKVATTATNVSICLQLKSIVDLDLKQEVLVINGYLTLSWVDEFLSWNMSDYGELGLLRLPPDQIWVPDVVLSNGLYDRPDALPKPNAVITYLGDVAYTPPFLYRIECDMDITYYPFDSQHCSFDFISWTYFLHEVSLSFNPVGGLDLSTYDKSAQFELLRKSRAEKKMEEMEVDGMIIRNEVMDITLYMRRKSLYYSYTIIWPAIAISIMSLLIFRISPDSGEKISLGVTVLLVFHVLLWSVGETLPENGETIPILAIYLSIIMLMTSVSIIMSVLVLNMHGRGSTKVPKLIRWLFLDKIAYVLCLEFETMDRISHRKMELQNKRLKYAMEELIDDLGNPHNDAEGEEAPLTTISMKRRRGENREISDEMLKILQIMLWKQQIESQETTAAEDWKKLAQVIDRLFFWIFFVIIILITVFLIAVIPGMS